MNCLSNGIEAQKFSKNLDFEELDDEIFNKIECERKSGKVGYYSLPNQDTKEIKAYAATINKKNIVVIGIGGSSLGAKAIYDFLLPSNNYKKDLLFLETIDPLKANYLLKSIDLSDSHFIIISKSGLTIETTSLFEYVNSLVTLDSRNSTIISESKSVLTQFANDNKIRAFDLAENIGGRFSVFSVVGLVPLAMVGVNIDNLLNGCKDTLDNFFNQGNCYKTIVEKSRLLVDNKSEFNINIVFSYSSLFESFNKWYVQLWAESLGKIDINGERQSLTPIALIGPVDQHSFLQLIMDGVRDKTVTFIKIDDLGDESAIPIEDSEKFDILGFQYIKGCSFNKLINMQADATINSVKEKKDIPYDVISMSSVDEYSISQLMFSYQLLVSYIAQLLNVNAYNQPGVEHGKLNLIEIFSNMTNRNSEKL